MTLFADTHCHIDLDAFDGDRDAMIDRAIQAGVRYMFLPNIDASGIRHLQSVVANYPSTCYPMMGLHPTSVKADYSEQMGVIEMELRKNPGNFCAIGEIGIDHYWDKTFAKEQEDVFVRQLELAWEFRLPVVIHTRNSMDIALEICEGAPKSPKGDLLPSRVTRERAGEGRIGVFHCFSGNLQQAERAIAMGFKLGIGGVITFKNSGLQHVVESVPLEHLLLETDAPFLAPVPFRGQRNEPSYIPYIAEKIAELKNITVEEVAEVTTESARRMFGITKDVRRET